MKIQRPDGTVTKAVVRHGDDVVVERKPSRMVDEQAKQQREPRTVGPSGKYCDQHTLVKIGLRQDALNHRPRWKYVCVHPVPGQGHCVYCIGFWNWRRTDKSWKLSCERRGHQIEMRSSPEVEDPLNHTRIQSPLCVDFLTAT